LAPAWALTPPAESASQYPLPDGVDAIPTTGVVRGPGLGDGAGDAADVPPAPLVTEKAVPLCSPLGVATLAPELDTVVIATGDCWPMAAPFTVQPVNETVP
jgi:hypothetical protein